jgi:acyl-CoA reductase-like NAD-dependent aldehyde dehydrogenase
MAPIGADGFVMAGSAVFAEAKMAVRTTPSALLDRAVAELTANKSQWARTSAEERMKLLDQVQVAVQRAAAGWVAAGVEAKGIDPASPLAGEEWLTGPYIAARYVRLLRGSLVDIARQGVPLLPQRAYKRANGRVVAPVFPTDLYDRLMFLGYRAEVWMQPGVTLDSLPVTMATAYREQSAESTVCLVLGAGNVSSIGPTDALGKLFIDNQVVLLKLNPVNDYLGPHIEQALEPLIDLGVLRIVYGGVEEGAYLCNHEDVDAIHITGSDKTHDAIVFGGGPEGEARKRQRLPLLDKPITSELGNVSAAIIVPGPWRRGDYTRQAENLAAMLTNNAGFNCNALRVIVTHREWDGREQLLEELRRLLAATPPRKAYYPGARERLERFVAPHPAAERFGSVQNDQELPWVLVTGVDPSQRDDVCFRTEAFCSLASETAISASDSAAFIERAVAFVNSTVWGSLNASLIVHPRSLRQKTVVAAVDRAIADLNVGTVAINHWAGLSYALGSTTWGAFPGHPLEDIQSGRGVVHNAFMFSQAEKSVLYGPFRPLIKPPWFPSHSKAHLLGPRLVDFESRPSPLRLPSIFLRALEL